MRQTSLIFPWLCSKDAAEALQKAATMRKINTGFICS